MRSVQGSSRVSPEHRGVKKIIGPREPRDSARRLRSATWGSIETEHGCVYVKSPCTVLGRTSLAYVRKWKEILSVRKEMAGYMASLVCIHNGLHLDANCVCVCK